LNNPKFWHAGAPLHFDAGKRWSAERLQATLSRHSFVSVDLHTSLTREQPVRSRTPSQVLSALAGSASTLTALHGVPLLDPLRHRTLGLAAFTRLRALTLRQASDAVHELRAAQLPASLEELTVTLALPKPQLERVIYYASVPRPNVPVLVDFEGMTNLRRISFGDYWSWELASRDRQTGQRGLLHTPPSLQVCWSLLSQHTCCPGADHDEKRHTAPCRT